MKVQMLSLVMLVLFCGACGLIDRKIAGYTGYSTLCIDDVKYIQFTSGASVKYKKNGQIETCD